MAWVQRNGYIIGAMPEGPQRFSSREEYENAYVDAIFDENNCFNVELPEDF